MKAYLQSKGVWGALIVVFGVLAQHDVAIRIGTEIYPLTDATGLVGAALALWGRATAKGPL